MSKATINTDLTGRVAIVTGASAGLGVRFAQTLARAGASVVACARREERLIELVGGLEKEGFKAAACALDVCDADAIKRAVDFAEQKFGRVDILVNNAGAADANWATKLSLELIDRVIDTNFRGPFLLSVEVARRLIAAKQRGDIINISSMGAFQYSRDSAAALYCGTKGGIARLTETLAVEWAAYNINVNAIAPGFFASEMTDGYIARVGKQATEGYPRGRFGRPEDLDSTLLYLVSPDSSFVTGTCIMVDDGQMPR